MHEYSVVIVDLQNENGVQMCLENDRPNVPYLYKLKYPKKEFLPTPLVLSIMQRQLSKQCLKIIFAGNSYTEEYSVVKVIKQNKCSFHNIEAHGLYDFIHAQASSKYGKKIKAEQNILANLIKTYAKEYEVIFELPTKWDRTTQTSVLDPYFHPLLKNQDDEVVSYIGYREEYGYEILLPVCEKKAELIEKLIISLLSSILPDFFPESKTFEWIKEEEFLPKELLELEKEKILIQEEYDSKIKLLNDRRKTINQKYKFLTDLLIETGDKLVQAVCSYFKWLGFENVEAIDGNGIMAQLSRQKFDVFIMN